MGGYPSIFWLYYLNILIPFFIGELDRFTNACQSANFFNIYVEIRIVYDGDYLLKAIYKDLIGYVH